MVPEGWSRCSLEDVADVRTGVAKGKENSDPIQLPYLRVANVQDGYLDLSEMKEIEVSARTIERYSLRYGDVVLTEGGDFDKLGRGALWRNEVENCLHQNHVFAVRANQRALLPEFFALQSASHYGKRYFLTCAKRSTNLASINSTQLKQFPVLLPPLPEQKKIAEVLATWDKAIETTEKLLTNAEAQKRALMQQLLTGQKRLPGFGSEPWQRVRLGDVFRERSERGGDELPLLSITSSRGVIPQNETDRKDTSREDKSSYKRIRRGDIGYNTMRMWQGVSALSQLDGLVSPAYTIVVPTKQIDPRYAAHLFKLPTQIHRFRRYSQGLTSDTWNLKFKQFSQVPATIPAVPEQKQIAAIIDSCDQQLGTAREALASLQSEKSALMQQLLTGKKRVRV